MAEVEIAIGKSKYKIGCEEGREENLIKSAERLNERVNRISFSFRNIDEKTLLVLCALTVEEELQKAKAQESNSSATEISDQDIFDAVSENMENMASYLEKLTKKILAS